MHREAATAIFINPTAKLLPDLTQSLPGQNHPAQVQTVHLDIQTLIRKVPAATAAARQGHDIFAKMLDKTEFRMDQIEKQLGKGFLNATDIAEHFAKQGIPFREAHAIVGHMVKACEKKGCDLEDLTDEELQAIDKRVTKELLGDISIKSCVNARVSFGGTAPSEVHRQIEVGRQWLNSLER